MAEHAKESAQSSAEVELTPRESAMLHQAGDRVFTLARRLAGLERDHAQLRLELQHLTDLLGETRSTRDVLSRQVESLQLERERDYEERAELRKLLVAMTGELQAALAQTIARPMLSGPPPLTELRSRSSAARSKPVAQQGLTGLVRIARREFARLGLK
jgi:hypothetical protein